MKTGVKLRETGVKLSKTEENRGKQRKTGVVWGEGFLR